MEPRRAILVDARTARPISQDWTPTVWPHEIEDANRRLEAMNLQWRWRPLERVLTLHGSVTLRATAGNVVV